MAAETASAMVAQNAPQAHADTHCWQLQLTHTGQPVQPWGVGYLAMLYQSGCIASCKNACEYASRAYWWTGNIVALPSYLSDVLDVLELQVLVDTSLAAG
jgi:hypothetical protein